MSGQEIKTILNRLPETSRKLFPTATSPRFWYIHRSAKATVAKTHRLVRPKPNAPNRRERPRRGAV